MVPAIRAGSSVTTIRSLGRRGVRTVAAADAPGVPATRSRYCDETCRVPSPREDLAGYTSALLDLARRDDVVTLVPLREPDIYVLATHRDRFADHVETPWPPRETVAHVQDRLRLVETARAVGVAVPETRLLDEWDDWDRTVVVKSRYAILSGANASSYHSVRFYDDGDPPAVDRVAAEMEHVPIAQSYVPGDEEFGFFALFDDGSPVATFTHRRRRSYTYAGGASVYRESVRVPEIESAGLALLRALDWHGPAMVEFKRDPRDETYRLMEINPRFWGSLALPVHAGVDFPALYYQLANGGVDDPHPSYEPGVGCHLLRGELVYLASVLRHSADHVDPPGLGRELAAVAASTVSNPHFDFLSLDDPRPFLSDLFVTARTLGG